MKNIKKAGPGFQHYQCSTYQQIKPVDREKCKICHQVTAFNHSFESKIQILCPNGCPNIKKTRGDSSSARSSGKPTLKNREKLTAAQKKQILEERFAIAARKAMVEEFFDVKEIKSTSGYQGREASLKKDKEPKDYKRILFFVGVFAGENPFYYDVLEISNDGADMRKTTDKNARAALAIIDKLDLPAVAKLNIGNAASHLNSYDVANTEVEEIDNAIELLYGIKRWSRDHYDAIAAKLSKTSIELLAEVKPWKPAWAK